MIISVCMATYNGEKYIKEQITSILIQLDNMDELIISDDSSTDKTLEIIESFYDKRIILYKNQNFGSPIFNFENAIKKAHGDIIVLSDQDDIWHTNKIEVIKTSFDVGKMSLKMFNGDCIDGNGIMIKKNLFEYLDVRRGLIENLKKNSFMGCNMAFNKELLKIVLPFPKDIPMHDMWIGSCAYLFGNVEFVDRHVFSYRVHGNNFTGRKSSLFKKVQWRYQLIKNLILRYFYVKFTA